MQERCNQIPTLRTLLTNHQSVLRLIGSNKNPFDILVGHINNEDELLQYSLSTGRSSFVEVIYFNRLFVAFFFKRYKEAAQYSSERFKSGQPKHIYFVFYEGLTANYFSRYSSGDELNKWLQIVETALSSFRAWVKHSTWNWENKLLLLEAESHFSRGEMEEAEEKYNKAIESAHRHRFIHEEGLANDLFSTFHRTSGNLDSATRHVAAARSCYEKWGAVALVELLDI
mmetsp:Transcript_551/g.1022  ORF Transcript_551/g.1022 Transcript_551/m.1022 type:complete len:228 (-) Transcript_551:107-790(-)